MAKATYSLRIFERFSGNELAKVQSITSIKDVNAHVKDYLRFTNVERVDVYKNGELFEFFGRENDARSAIKVKDGKVSVIKL